MALSYPEPTLQFAHAELGEGGPPIRCAIGQIAGEQLRQQRLSFR